MIDQLIQRQVACVEALAREVDPICSQAFPWWAVALTWATDQAINSHFPSRLILSAQGEISWLAIKKQLPGEGEIGVANHLVVAVSEPKHAHVLGHVACYRERGAYVHRGPEPRPLLPWSRQILQDFIFHDPQPPISRFAELTQDPLHPQIPGTLVELFDRYVEHGAQTIMDIAAFCSHFPQAVVWGRGARDW